jgi:hypothetical protein
MLGFELDENEVLQRGLYYVKSVDTNSASALAGLKPGDKITKINGKTTVGMGYEEFCHEIAIAHQQQQRNNMIHLMVMRRSSKHTGSSSYLATTTTTTAHSSVSNFSGPTVLPIKNQLAQASRQTQQPSSILSTSTSSNLYNEKTSSFVDEGYVPGSATSATSSSTTAALGGTGSATQSQGNLVSVVRVTSPINQAGKNTKKTKNLKTKH